VKILITNFIKRKNKQKRNAIKLQYGFNTYELPIRDLIFNLKSLKNDINKPTDLMVKNEVLYIANYKNKNLLKFGLI